MTFSGIGLSDLETILDTFPRTFTIKQIEERCGMSRQRVRQAIVWGNQTDMIRIVSERCAGDENVVIYENIRWRAEWVKRAWRTQEIAEDERELASR
jgi:hypothetical protein